MILMSHLNKQLEAESQVKEQVSELQQVLDLVKGTVVTLSQQNQELRDELNKMSVQNANIKTSYKELVKNLNIIETDPVDARKIAFNLANAYEEIGKLKAQVASQDKTIQAMTAVKQNGPVLAGAFKDNKFKSAIDAIRKEEAIKSPNRSKQNSDESNDFIKTKKPS